MAGPLFCGCLGSSHFLVVMKSVAVPVFLVWFLLHLSRIWWICCIIISLFGRLNNSSVWSHSWTVPKCLASTPGISTWLEAVLITQKLCSVNSDVSAWHSAFEKGKLEGGFAPSSSTQTTSSHECLSQACMTTGMSSLWVCLVGGPATLVGEKTGSGQSGTGIQWLCACLWGCSVVPCCM